MLELGVPRPSQSPWSTPVLLVKRLMEKCAFVSMDDATPQCGHKERRVPTAISRVYTFQIIRGEVPVEHCNEKCILENPPH